MTMNRWGPKTWAHIGLAVQFLALIRCLVEYFRLKHVDGSSFDPLAAEVFIRGALIVAVLTAASVAAYVFQRPKWTAALAIATVCALLVVKATMV